jgi:hypothetical protein
MKDEYIYVLADEEPIQITLPIWLPTGTEFLHNGMAYKVDSYYNNSVVESGMFGCSRIGRYKHTLAQEADEILRSGSYEVTAPKNVTPCQKELTNDCEMD